MTNVRTGASSNPDYPFTIEWTCRGSTTDGNTDEICEAFAQPAECGIAHEADHESLSSNDSDLCEFGQVRNFGTRSPLDPANETEYTWTCQGGDASGVLNVQCEAYVPEDPTDGLCNALTNNNSYTYDTVKDFLQCTQGTPSAPILPNPTNNEWTYSCLGVNGGVDVQCTIGEITNAQCTQYNVMVTTVPTVLCDAGLPDTPIVNSGSWIYTCAGENGGSNDSCSVACRDGICDDGTPVCLPNGSGSSINDQPVLAVGEVCNNACGGGCVCGSNTIINGSTCTAFIPDFDGYTADLTIRTHTANSGSVYRGDRVTFTMYYKNNGPDNAT